MTPASCPRLFEVAAARDGRLVGAELSSFERHMATCSTCSREAEALEAPAAALRATSTGERDELHARRERTRLLATFDAELVAPRRRWGGWLFWPVPVAALVLGLLIVWRMRPPASEPTSSAVVRASNAAAWSEHTQAGLEQVRLLRGSLWLHVDHSSNHKQRLLVILPDGELEDTGTTFTVTADGEHTTRIEVQDGSVVLRVRGRLAVTLSAGQTWSPDAAASAGPADPSDPVPSGSGFPIAPPRGSHEPPTLAATPDPSAEFRVALAELDAGDSAGAAAAFASFLLKYPRDPRAEDAAYLRVMALRRSSDDDKMKQAAREYLHRYPTGFRRTEVEALLRQPR